MTKENNEDLNNHVFTTKYILDKTSEIVYVIHDEDGDWQFLGHEDDINEKDARVVSLGEIFEFDPTLKELINLPIGKEAIRKDKNSPWEILS